MIFVIHFLSLDPNKNSSPTCHDTGAEDDVGAAYEYDNDRSGKRDEFGKQQEEGDCCSSGDVHSSSTTTAPLHDSLLQNSHQA